MNKYNSSSLIFNSISGKKVQAHFDRGGQKPTSIAFSSIFNSMLTPS
jgi:hypothetical protein